ncbi:hypothetical protein AAVH_32720 [Aphelenchoides avenae]|nr:hypothetical protein AAVH_32720 [Aphelenchus avenae]
MTDPRPSSHLVLIARPSDATEPKRSLAEKPEIIAEQLYPENDTFCLLPSRMRCLCLVITMLLIISLAAAIGNSIQNAGFKSVSFCKNESEEFSVQFLYV